MFAYKKSCKFLFEILITRRGNTKEIVENSNEPLLNNIYLICLMMLNTWN